MKTKTINIYRFNELDGNAMIFAKGVYKESIGYNDGDDAIKSMQALAKHFDVIINNQSINWFHEEMSWMNFRVSNLTVKEIEKRLLKLGEYNLDTLRGFGEWTLTGYCMDESAIDGFRIEFYKLLNTNNTKNLLDLLMQAAFCNWLEAVQADCASFYEDKQFSEHCNVNNYWYLKNGEMTTEI